MVYADVSLCDVSEATNLRRYWHSYEPVVTYKRTLRESSDGSSAEIIVCRPTMQLNGLPNLRPSLARVSDWLIHYSCVRTILRTDLRRSFGDYRTGIEGYAWFQARNYATAVKVGCIH